MVFVRTCSVFAATLAALAALARLLKELGRARVGQKRFTIRRRWNEKVAPPVFADSWFLPPPCARACTRLGFQLSSFF